MEEEYLFTLEEIRTALSLGMNIALLLLEKSTTSTTDEIKYNAERMMRVISDSFFEKEAA
ncbi:MAG: hypothetical protein FK734_19420 [Asgard group archaeon]|nr:hypothetical protein [Asgard group archaeon]